MSCLVVIVNLKFSSTELNNNVDIFKRMMLDAKMSEDQNEISDEEEEDPDYIPEVEISIG